METNNIEQEFLKSNITPSRNNIFNSGPVNAETVNMPSGIGGLAIERLLEAVRRSTDGSRVRTCVDLDEFSTLLIPSGMSEQEAIELHNLVSDGVFTFYSEVRKVKEEKWENDSDFHYLEYEECGNILLAAAQKASEQGYGFSVQIARYGHVFIPPCLTEDQVRFLNRMLFSGVEILRK